MLPIAYRQYDDTEWQRHLYGFHTSVLADRQTVSQMSHLFTFRMRKMSLRRVV